MYSNCILFQYEEENTNVIIEDKDTTKLNRELDKFCDVKKIILDFSSVNFIDLVGVKAIRRVSCLMVNRNSSIMSTCLFNCACLHLHWVFWLVSGNI